MVGTRCFETEDKSRREFFKDGKDSFRRLKVRFYYPGKEDPTKKLCDFYNEKVLKEVKVKADLNAYRQRESIYEDLEIEDGIFPLILYSHGYGSIAESNSDLCRHLAENGYIVASISHTYEELETRFSDGEIVPFDQKTYKKMTKPLIPAYLDLILMGKKEDDL